MGTGLTRCTRPHGRWSRTGLIAAALLAALHARAQYYGYYTLTGGTATVSAQTFSAAATNQSAVFVTAKGRLTMNNMTLVSSGNTTNTDVSSQYGLNATLLAKTGTVSMTGGSITSSGSGANLAFATGPGSVIGLTNVALYASGGNAHAVDVTYCGVIAASNVTMVTRGGSSSAIATDYGGGTVTVCHCEVTVNGNKSAAIYSTGLISVFNSTCTSSNDYGAVIDVDNAIVLSNTVLTGKSGGVQIHRTVPSTTGTAYLTATEGRIVGTAGNCFDVNAENGLNTAVIALYRGVQCVSSTGVLLSLTKKSTATLIADGVALTGAVSSADSATNAVYIALQNGSALSGAINSAKRLTIDSSSAWTTTASSVVNVLTNSGTLAVSGTLTTTNVIVKSGGALGGSGALSSNLVLNSGARLILCPTGSLTVGGGVSCGGAVTVVLPATNLASGAYRLLAYLGALSGAPTFTCLGADGERATVSTNTAGVITVTVASSSTNTSPLLTPITNRTVNAGTRLSITNVATDADTPAQTLVFSLLAGPTNASLDAANGVLSWRPLVSQAGLTNAFTTCVTDSGSPALSATQSFSVVVRPLSPTVCSAFVCTSGVCRLTISGTVGPDYIVQSCTNLARPAWATLRTNTPARLPFVWSDPDAFRYPARFYRIRLGP